MKAATKLIISATPFKAFQSTPPVKAATRKKSNNTANNSISIHAAREGGDSNRVEENISIGISIHAAREGGDAANLEYVGNACSISIHAAREGGDYTTRVPECCI